MKVKNMSNPAKEKSLQFGVQIVKMARKLQEEEHEYIVSRQILKSGTSIGANIRESQNAQSKPDFINKLSIALKEADETQYWLELMVLSEMITKEHYSLLEQDLKEIIAILTSSIKTAKANENKA